MMYQTTAKASQEMKKEAAKLSSVVDQLRSIIDVKKSFRNLNKISVNHQKITAASGTKIRKPAQDQEHDSTPFYKMMGVRTTIDVKKTFRNLNKISAIDPDQIEIRLPIKIKRIHIDNTVIPFLK